MIVHQATGLCMQLSQNGQLVMGACDRNEKRQKWNWKKNPKFL